MLYCRRVCCVCKWFCCGFSDLFFVYLVTCNRRTRNLLTDFHSYFSDEFLFYRVTLNSFVPFFGVARLCRIFFVWSTRILIENSRKSCKFRFSELLWDFKSKWKVVARRVHLQEIRIKRWFENHKGDFVRTFNELRQKKTKYSVYNCNKRQEKKSLATKRKKTQILLWNYSCNYMIVIRGHISEQYCMMQAS